MEKLLLLGLILVGFNEVILYETDGPNFSKIPWVHAVNNKTYLENVLKDKAIMMIEADVSFGQLNNEGPLIPIMAQPLAKTSDLSLAQFLETIDEFNQKQVYKETRKGIKLNFKNTDVFQHSFVIIGPLHDKMNISIWFNADIIRGPLNATTPPVDKDVFLSNSKIYSNVVLSLGWTTIYGGGVNNVSYTDQQTQNMIDAVNSNGITTEEVTFAVRAGIVANSRSQMKTLRDNFANCTLTIWSKEDDYVDLIKLRKVIRDFGVNRVYIDVPKDLFNQLNLSKEKPNESDPKVHLSWYKRASIFLSNLSKAVF